MAKRAAAKKKVMIVDDDPDFLDFSGMVLKEAGYKVAAFPGEEEALEYLKKDVPDIMVLDVMMAKLDSGFQLLWKVKKDTRLKDVPVIMLTAVDREMHMDFAKHAKSGRQDADEQAYLPVTDYIVKPVNAADLAGRIEKALDGKKRAGV